MSRRSLLGLAGAAAVGSALLDPAWFRSEQRLSSDDDDAWPMSRGGPERTGFAERGPTEEVGVAWHRDLGDSFPGLALPVAVADETVYTATRYAVHALDAADGTPRWEYGLSGEGWFGSDFFQSGTHFVQSPPVVGDEGVYICAGSDLFAVGSRGTARWQYDTSSSFEDVLVVGNTAYFTSNLDSETLVALDTDSGVPRWTDTPAPILPRAYGDGLLVGPTLDRDEGVLRAVSAETGTTQWSRELTLADPYRLVPTVADGTVFYGDTTLYALDAETGETRWTYETPDDSGLAPVVAGDTVYVVAEFSGLVVALDAETGEVRWERTVERAESVESPAVTADTLYLAAGRAAIGLDTSDGTERFRVGVPGGGVDSFALAGGTLYVGSGETVVALREGER
ncbi:Outer membrane protein assembly factor BamB, contains PQQ-like beta-propeller repeat [Halogranum gelatinilyticum]|uniref:Outer membrane protein assembly factor BamB, contains PQQ-like beta-propeller repeat n=1 Tax=Halogranum gelatinilyticum TaxID=660521 RepID=A0A1G9XYJ6_9EURY|nr:Outer membrane protein assembly factor BamB, contains PQQ-like beta-propeller repeat [Halogranum gelatinilyticum]